MNEKELGCNRQALVIFILREVAWRKVTYIQYSITIFQRAYINIEIQWLSGYHKNPSPRAIFQQGINVFKLAPFPSPIPSSPNI